MNSKIDKKKIDKNILRDKMKKLRAGLSISEREEKDLLVYKNFMSLKILKETEWIYIFASYGTEVDTLKIIEVLLQSQGKKVALPRVSGKEMEFYEINSMEDLKPGYNGILEPVSDTKVLTCNGIMVMPGLVFDTYHGRIGYGGGYYDRYLYKHKEDNIFKVALAYDFQVLRTERIAMESHDICPDIIITEKVFL